MVKRIAFVFVLSSIYVGVAYLLWISKSIVVDELVSIPLLIVAVFRKDLNPFERFMVAFTGIVIFQGAKVELLTSQTAWRSILAGTGASLIRSRSPKKLFSFIIPPVMPAIFQLMSSGWKIAVVNYVSTAVILYIITRREV